MRFWNLYLIVLCSLLFSCSRQVAESRAQLGDAEVTVRLHPVEGSKKWPESLEVFVVRPSFLEDVEEADQDFIGLKYDGKEWTGTIPMELNRTNRCGVILKDSSENFFEGFIVGISQDSPSVIDIFQKGNRLDSIAVTGGTGWCANMDYLNIYGRFIENYKMVPKQQYSRWEDYIACELDSVFPIRAESSLGDYPLAPEHREWIVNGFRTIYFAGRISYYKDDAKNIYNLDVKDPPVEFYREFLKQMDFSPELLDNYAANWLFKFLTTFFNRMPLDLGQIGDTDIQLWQAQAADKVGKVVPEVTPTLLDLLTATSYLMQIKEGIPLTHVQKENINRHFTNDDLGKLILKRNESLTKDLEKTVSSLTDLASGNEAFDIQELLDRYPGKPVVVDFWNTWCAPCIMAMKEIKAFKDTMPPSDIVFVYIADDSSPLKKWEGMSQRHSGVHLRISDASKDVICEKYDITGVPYYLFFDSKHNLVYKCLGFPGVSRYSELLDEICR